MKPELLSRIADIINSNSTHFHAVIPTAQHEYMTQAGDKLVKTYCLVLKIMLVGKAKYHRKRTVWNIFEADMDKIISKISRRDGSFSSRMNSCTPTPTDVEILIRRASLQSLKLNLSRTAFGVYTD